VRSYKVVRKCADNLKVTAFHMFPSSMHVISQDRTPNAEEGVYYSRE
jgi:hypothetical protein